MDIVLENVSKAFGENKVISSLSAAFPEGKITCIGGASGSGKTTLLRMIAGLEKPDSGEISGVPAKIAFVFQEDRLSESFSAVSNVALVTGRKMPRREIKEHLEALSLAEAAGRPVCEFSGGMKRRVALARAVCYGGDLLLMDEPFKGLDEEMKKKAMDYVRRFAAGKTVLCVTHDASVAEYFGCEMTDIKKLQG